MYECATLKELNKKECEYIKYYNSFGQGGYNMTSGGDEFIRSNETKDKISKALSGIKRSEKTKQKLRDLYIGKTYEEIHGKEKAEQIKTKISATLTGHKTSEETRKKIGDIHRGKIVSEEARKNISK